MMTANMISVSIFSIFASILGSRFFFTEIDTQMLGLYSCCLVFMAALLVFITKSEI